MSDIEQLAKSLNRINQALVAFGDVALAWVQKLLPLSQSLYDILFNIYAQSLPEGEQPTPEGFETWLDKQQEDA